jgi:uncharacterized protein
LAINKYIGLWLLWLLPLGLLAQLPEPMRPARLVNDFAGILQADEREQLERMLVAYDDSTSTQICIVTIRTLDGYEVADYANRLFEKWGIGGKQNNNGVLLLLALEERKVRIETGYGVEDRLTDALSRRIIEQQLLPAFRQQAYAKGFNAAVTTITEILSGAYTAETRSGKKPAPIWVLLVFFFIIILIMIANARNGGGGSSYTGRGSSHYRPFFFPMGGGSSWGGGGGGGSFGGFGGFGGGMSGGGGASGGW